MKVTSRAFRTTLTLPGAGISFCVLSPVTRQAQTISQPNWNSRRQAGNPILAMRPKSLMWAPHGPPARGERWLKFARRPWILRGGLSNLLLLRERHAVPW